MQSLSLYPGAAVSARSGPALDGSWLMLALHLVVWSWVGIALRTNLDLPGDMVEAYAWGQGWQWGYFKHPPLSAWLAGAWFSVFPTGDASYSVLGAMNMGLALAGFCALARDTLPAAWRLPSLAAAMLLPAATVMSLRFNANAVLLSTWPWVVWFFLRTMRSGRLRDAAGLGLTAALAMLGKYFSGVLLLTLLAAVLAHPPWRGRLGQRCTAVALLSFLLLLWPHLLWLRANDYGPLLYARQATQQVAGSPAMRALQFVAGQGALLLPALGLLAWTARHVAGWRVWQRVLGDLLRPAGQPAWWWGVGPVVVAAVATVLTGARTVSVWGLPMTLLLCLFVAQRLSVHAAALALQPAASPARTLLVPWLVAALAAPAFWAVQARQGNAAVAEPRAELALAVEAAWAARHPGQRLPWVAGSEALAASVSFYGKSRPAYWSLRNPAQHTPWVDVQQVLTDGGALVCTADDRLCADAATGWGGQVENLIVAKHARGVVFPAATYTVGWLPPGGAAATGAAKSAAAATVDSARHLQTGISTASSRQFQRDEVQ